MSDTFKPIKLSARDTELLALYAEDLFTDEQAEELNARLHAEPALLTAIAQFSEIEEHLHSLLVEEHAADQGEWYEIMTELAQAERQAEAKPVELTQPKRVKANRDEPRPSAKEVADVLWYLGKSPKVWGPIAAVLVLALTLTIVLITGPNTPEPIADDRNNTNPNNTNPNEPGGVGPADTETIPSTPTLVATLTAERDAVWDRQPGQDLYPGERYTLKQGFAEITTARGAVAILEAPATVEFMDSLNAVYLHAGRLVGVCETPSSKGFTVVTDTAKVTDIGTVFGVERDLSGRTLVGVLEGYVALNYQSADVEPRLLKAGDVAGVSAEGLAIAALPNDVSERFSGWDSLLRPVTVTGDAVLLDSVPAQFPENDALVHVYREPTGLLLQEDLVVSRTEPGLYRPTDATERSTVVAGTRVDSYFVHINRPNRPTHRVTRTFTISFDQPVIALIVHTDLVISTNGLLGDPDARYLKAGGLGLVSKSGFEPDAPQVDSIQWSDDRKTLSVTLNIEDADQFRVLTLSPEAASAAGTPQ